MRVLPLDFADWEAAAEFLATGDRGAKCFGSTTPPIGQFVLLEFRVGGLAREFLRGRVVSLLGRPGEPDWMKGCEVHYMASERDKLDYLRRVAAGRIEFTRREPRLPVQLAATVSAPFDTRSRSEAALAEDIGRWGAFLRTNLAAPQDALIWVAIESGVAELGTLSLKARVAWGGPRGLGVSFVPYNETECGIVIDWVERLEAEVRRDPASFCLSEDPLEE
jgi:hypothetical protein